MMRIIDMTDALSYGDELDMKWPFTFAIWDTVRSRFVQRTDGDQAWEFDEWDEMWADEKQWTVDFPERGLEFRDRINGLLERHREKYITLKNGSKLEVKPDSGIHGYDESSIVWYD